MEKIIKSLYNDNQKHSWALWIWGSQLLILLPCVGYIITRVYFGPPLGAILIPLAILLFAYTLFTLWNLFTRWGQRWVKRYRWEFVLSFCSILLTYAVSEIIVSLFFAPKYLDTFGMFDNPTFHFDPVRGYRIAQTPARQAFIIDGTVETLGVYQGNSDGFPDRDDFTVQKQSKKKKRIAVLGDSFTSAQFLKTNWPDLVDQLAAENKAPFELYNFGISGGGLANWWSVLLKLIEAEGYEFDGIVFAVYPVDLYRRFTMLEHRGFHRHMMGRVTSWEPTTYPKSLVEALPHIKKVKSYFILPPDQFEKALEQRRLPLGFYPYLASNMMRLIKKRKPLTKEEILDDPQRKQLIEDIRDYFQRSRLPVIVVHVPEISDLLAGHTEVPKETMRFGQSLDAKIINGSLAFEGLSETELRAHWLPRDFHWGQQGSDRFGKFMYTKLGKWMKL